MSINLPYFINPTQVIYYDIDGNHYTGGIAWRDTIICGCCGGTILIAELFEFVPEGCAALIALPWINIEEEIRRDITGETDAE